MYLTTHHSDARGRARGHSPKRQLVGGGVVDEAEGQVEADGVVERVNGAWAGDQYQLVQHVQCGHAGLIHDKRIVSTLSSKRASAGALKKIKICEALIGAGISS